MNDIESLKVRLQQEVAQLKLFRQATGDAFSEDRAPTAYGREIQENTSRGMDHTHLLLTLMAICTRSEPQESRAAAGAADIQEQMLARFNSIAEITGSIANLLDQAYRIEQTLLTELKTLEQMREHTMETLATETDERREQLDFL